MRRFSTPAGTTDGKLDDWSCGGKPAPSGGRQERPPVDRFRVSVKGRLGRSSRCPPSEQPATGAFLCGAGVMWRRYQCTVSAHPACGEATQCRARACAEKAPRRAIGLSRSPRAGFSASRRRAATPCSCATDACRASIREKRDTLTPFPARQAAPVCPYRRPDHRSRSTETRRCRRRREPTRTGAAKRIGAQRRRRSA